MNLKRYSIETYFSTDANEEGDFVMAHGALIEIERLRESLKSVLEYIQEIEKEREGCGHCGAESACFTCGLLLSASHTIYKALEGKC